MCPGGAASDEDEPAISEAVADPCSCRCQKIIADGELHGNRQAHGCDNRSRRIGQVPWQLPEPLLLNLRRMPEMSPYQSQNDPSREIFVKHAKNYRSSTQEQITTGCVKLL